jgi:glutathione synthase/RimK-type ligase-like ATP-grasp enzyme
MKYKVGILKCEVDGSHLKWAKACEKRGVYYKVIELTRKDWLQNVVSEPFDILLLRPSGRHFRFKYQYDERLYILNKIMGFATYPTYDETFFYENKAALSYYLKAKGIPHPATHVFYYEEEALSFMDETKFPLVAKTSIGGSGTGVKIIKSRNQLNRYIMKAFGSGIKRRLGPNRNTGNIKSWAKKSRIDYNAAIKKLKGYLALYKDVQKGFVIFQEYIPHDFEWRIVKIGDSYFGHQKIKIGDKASGSKGINYVAPGVELLNFTRKICDENRFNTMAIDLFEHPSRGFLVNEMQTIFGHVQDHILEVNGKAGRYIFHNNEWIFEEGDFNTNESYDLRLENALTLIKK